MEQLVEFNGVKILLTTGESLHEVQNFLDEDPDIILSVYPGRLRILKPYWLSTAGLLAFVRR